MQDYSDFIIVSDEEEKNEHTELKLRTLTNTGLIIAVIKTETKFGEEKDTYTSRCCMITDEKLIDFTEFKDGEFIKIVSKNPQVKYIETLHIGNINKQDETKSKNELEIIHAYDEEDDLVTGVCKTGEYIVEYKNTEETHLSYPFVNFHIENETRNLIGAYYDEKTNQISEEPLFLSQIQPKLEKLDEQ